MDAITNHIKFSPQTKKIAIVFIILITIVAGTFNAIFSYIAFALSVITVFFATEEDSLCFLMFIMPFASIFKNSPGAQSFFTYLLLFYVLLGFIKKTKIQFHFILVFLFFLVFLVFQMFISINILKTIKFVANLLFLYFAINTRTNDDNKKIYLCFILGVALSSLIASLNVIPNLDSYVGVKELGYEYDGVARFSGLYADPNYYSVNVIISSCLIIILSYKKQISEMFAGVLLCLMVVFSIMTFSKSAFLMMLLVLLLFVYSKLRQRKYVIVVSLFALGIVACSILLAGKIEAFNMLFSRFDTSNGISSVTTGRSDLWINYIDFLRDSPKALFLGVGFGGELIGGMAAHNTYIDLVYYLGIVGTFLFFVLFFLLVDIGNIGIKRNILNYSVLMCVLLMYFFLSELFYFDWAFHIVIAVFVMRTKITHTKEV